MRPIRVSHFTGANAIGVGLDEINTSLQNVRTGLHPCDFPNAKLNAYIGSVMAVDDINIWPGFKEYNCRNNRLAQLGLLQDGFIERVNTTIEKYGKTRVAVVIGTSTSGVESLEQAYRDRDPISGKLPNHYRVKTTFNFYSVTDFVKYCFKLRGPSHTIATACSSSNKVFAAAYRLMAAGLCDAAIVGGVDSLCLNTLYGFNSLQLLSESPCKPCDQNRSGISLGEAAGFALLEWADCADNGHGIEMIGYGESSDAFHMSSPPPDGNGARLAMDSALKMARLAPEQVDYINLHGTGSQINDITENKAVVEVFGTDMLCTATKGYTGHTLAAAGITESIISFLSMLNGYVPATANTQVCDPELIGRINLETRRQKVTHVLSNSFGFGGNNCSLLFKSGS